MNFSLFSNPFESHVNRYRKMKRLAGQKVNDHLPNSVRKSAKNNANKQYQLNMMNIASKPYKSDRMNLAINTWEKRKKDRRDSVKSSKKTLQPSNTQKKFNAIPKPKRTPKFPQPHKRSFSKMPFIEE